MPKANFNELVKSLKDKNDSNKQRYDNLSDQQIIIRALDAVQNSVIKSISVLVETLVTDTLKTEVTNQLKFPTNIGTPDALAGSQLVKESIAKLQQAVIDKNLDVSSVVSQLENIDISLKNLPTSYPDFPELPTEMAINNLSELSAKLDELNQSVSSLRLDPKIEVSSPEIKIDLSKEIKAIEKAVKSIATEVKFPEQKETNLQPLIKAVQAVKNSIETIQFPIPNFNGREIVEAINNITIPAPVGGATEAKQQEQIDLMKCIVSTDASTTTPLNKTQTYTGNWINFLPWTAAIITVVTNANSTLFIEYSQDGTNVVSTLTRQETITATQSGAFVVGRRANYFRVRLTANANQTSLNMQTILSAREVQMDAQPIEDLITNKYIAETVRSILTAKKPNNDYTNIRATAGGNLKVSLEEVDGGAVIPVTSPTYKTLIDETSTPSVTYIGKADIGTLESAASWQISKIDESGSVTSITWSGKNFNAIWDNRTAISYS